MSIPLLSVVIRYEHDVVGARQRTRQIAETLGFDPTEQTRLATAVSEISRNAFVYAGGERREGQKKNENESPHDEPRRTQSGPLSGIRAG